MNAETQPLLTSEGCAPRPITLVVFAPFGSDDTLSRYPDDLTNNVKQHPLVLALTAVAAAGVNVCALVDRVDDDSWRIDIPAGGEACFTSMWKQRMSSPRSLAGLLAHAMQQHQGSAVVLSMEGHGAGYLPEIDTAKLAATKLPKVNGERVYWVQRPDDEGGAAIWDRKGDSPPLSMDETLLPDGRTPGTEIPMSTWGLGWALEEARRRCGGEKADKIAVVHFNNCFNFSTELLHTIAPHAEFATGYSNYNFFTAGRYYPAVFRNAQAQRALGAEALARALCEGNRDELKALARPHPTVGGMVQLSRLAAIADAVDKLAKALVAELPAQRPEIAKAIRAAQQFDADASFTLEVPDSLTDLASLASALGQAPLANAVKAAAQTLAATLRQIKVYGEKAKPWVDPNVLWDFKSEALAMNIYLPDPDLSGILDWRAPYYMNKQPGALPAQPKVVDFLQSTAWVDFILAYLKGVRFVGLLAPIIPTFPPADQPGDCKPW
jgi:Clostripain family